MDKYLHPTFSRVCDYLSMLKLKLIHVSKRGPWGGYKVNLIHSVVFTLFRFINNFCTYLISRSYLTGVLAAVISPIKYERDQKDLRGTFAKSKYH